ncbi:MAG: FHA domain-containing protein [Planctomycetes bacterium]|nr:FHA domain-containing protein [Planctomycetota bacterium]
MATLLIENGPEKGRGIELKAGISWTLGRDTGCDLKLQGDLVSRKHCMLKEFKGGYYVKDLDSLNGTFLNDQAITQVELKPGDKLQLGDVVLTFLDESLAKTKEEKKLGGYRLLERVGRGGMGTVYRAIQISLDREVALKLLSPELVKDKAFIEQFFREARAAGQLNHPHIVQVYDVGQDGETFYYSMEYVRGGSLEDLLREQGKLDVAEALRIAHEAAQALEYAELRGIVHRDIKPDNLMLAEDGRVRVADLGLALSLKSSADTKGQPILGTPHFISPEQALRRDIDIRSDLYSLGATLYRMLAGRTVFTGASAEEIIRKAVRDEPEPLRSHNPQVPEKVAALVHRLLRKDPDQRFASAKELRVELDVLRRPPRTKALLVSVCVAVLAITAAIVIVLTRPDPPPPVVDTGDLQKQRADNFAMKSEVEKRKIELEAVRRYLDVFETGAAEDTALRDALDLWLDEFEYLEIPERDRARAKVGAIDDAVRAAVEALAAVERRRSERLVAARSAVETRLAAGEWFVALAAAAAIGADAGDDAATAALLAPLREELVAAVLQQIDTSQGQRAKAIDDAVAAGDLESAATLCRSAAAEFHLAAETALPDTLRERVGGLSAAFDQRRHELSTRADETVRAAAARDRERRQRALGAPTRAAVLSLDFGGAADRIAAVAAEIESSSDRAQVEPWEAALRHGQTLLDRLFARLEAPDPPAQPALRLDGVDRAGELVGCDREKRQFRLRNQVGRASSSVTIDFAAVASADGLRQLLVGRIDLSSADRLLLAELMTLVDVLRWAEQVAPLAERLARYDASLGWDDSCRSGLVAPAAGALADAVDFALKDISAEQAGGALQQRTRARAEQLAWQELRTALDPFFRADGNVGWNACVENLRRLLVERGDTLLLQVARPWIEGG